MNSIFSEFNSEVGRRGMRGGWVDRNDVLNLMADAFAADIRGREHGVVF